jgi:hypothetical protein
MIHHIPETVSPEHRAIVGFEWEVIERWLRADPGRIVLFNGKRWVAKGLDQYVFRAPTVPLLAGKLADDLAKDGVQ